MKRSEDEQTTSRVDQELGESSRDSGRTLVICYVCGAACRAIDDASLAKPFRFQCIRCRARNLVDPASSLGRLPDAKSDDPGDPTTKRLLDWYVSIAGKPEGPFSEDDLQAKIVAGEITERSYIWRSGMPMWKRIEGCEEVIEILGDMTRPFFRIGDESETTMKRSESSLVRVGIDDVDPDTLTEIRAPKDSLPIIPTDKVVQAAGHRDADSELVSGDEAGDDESNYVCGSPDDETSVAELIDMIPVKGRVRVSAASDAFRSFAPPLSMGLTKGDGTQAVLVPPSQRSVGKRIDIKWVLIGAGLMLAVVGVVLRFVSASNGVVVRPQASTLAPSAANHVSPALEVSEDGVTKHKKHKKDKKRKIPHHVKEALPERPKRERDVGATKNAKRRVVRRAKRKVVRRAKRKVLIGPPKRVRRRTLRTSDPPAGSLNIPDDPLAASSDVVVPDVPEPNADVDEILSVGVASPVQKSRESKKQASAERKSAPQTLSRAQISKAMARLKGPVQGCFDTYGESGIIRLKITLHAYGRAQGRAEAPFAEKETGACVLRALRGMKFPEFTAPDPIIFKYAYDLK